MSQNLVKPEVVKFPSRHFGKGESRGIQVTEVSSRSCYVQMEIWWTYSGIYDMEYYGHMMYLFTYGLYGIWYNLIFSQRYQRVTFHAYHMHINAYHTQTLYDHIWNIIWWRSHSPHTTTSPRCDCRATPRALSPRRCRKMRVKMHCYSTLQRSLTVAQTSD